jgi:tetratricopeptide (TPR) repeat protein
MTAYRAARALAATAPQLYLKEGVLRLRLGQYTQALRWYTRGLKATGAGDPTPLGVELGLAYAGVRYYQGRYRECIDWCLRMADVAMSIDDRTGLAHAYSLLYLAYTHLGSEERSRYRDLALPLYEEIGDLTGQANVLNNLGIEAYYEGDWEQALELYERSRQVQEKTGNLIFVADTVNNIAEILSDQGRLEEAERRFSESLSTYRAAGYAMGEAFAIGNLGRLAARAGRHDDAVGMLEDALVRQRQIGDERNAAELEARIAEALVFAGRADEAAERAEAVLAEVDRIGGMTVLRAFVLRVIGYAKAQVAETEAARQILEQSIEAALAAEASYEAALGMQALGRVLQATGDPRAHEVLSEADALLAKLRVVSTPEVPLPP